MPTWAVILAAFGVISVLPPFLQASQPPSLPPGERVERPMTGGEAHSYCIEAVPEARLLITVEQEGIDVEVVALRPDGTTLAAVDGPTESEGPEILLLPANVSGPLEIVVRSPGRGAAPGVYTLVLEELAESTPAERDRLEAYRLLTAAEAQNRDGTGPALQQAAAAYAAACALWRALGDRGLEAWCELAAGGVASSLGEPKPALAHDERARDLAVEVGDAVAEAAAWQAAGVARTALGDTAEAAAAERRALTLNHLLGRPYEEAKTANHLGLALHLQGELREAQRNYEQALALFTRLGEEGDWKGKVLHNLAAIHMSLGETEEALASHEKVLSLQRALGDRQGEAQTLNSLGVLHYDRGEIGQAIAAYTEALASFRQAGDRLWEATLLHNLGVAYYGLGDYPRALSALEQALAIRHEVSDRRGETTTEVSLGHTELMLGHRESAWAAGQRAALLASAGSDRGGELLARTLLAEIELAGRPEAALVELAKALDLARGLDDRLDQTVALQLLGEAHLALHEPAKALAVLAEAIELARSVSLPARLVGSLVAASRAERMLGRPAESRARLEEALRLIEGLRAEETDPELRASFLAAKHDAFEQEIDLLMEGERREPGKGYAAEALAASERARARSLLDLLQEASASVREGVDPALRERERALLLRLEGKTGREAGLLRRRAPEESRRAAEAETRAALEDLTAVEAEIRRRSPRYAALTQPVLAASAEIQRLLGDDTLLLEYSLGRERSFLWAVDRKTVRGFSLPPRAEIEATAAAAYRELSVHRSGDAGREPAAAVAALGRMLLAPVRDRLGAKRLVIVADGALHSIPFGALPEPGAGGKALPLLARHEVVNAPSASTVALERRLARPAPAPSTVAVLADPVFTADDPRVVRPAARRSPAGAPAAGARSGEGGLLRLPWTRREAEAIAAVAPAGQSLVALDFRASRETALSPELSRYRIVHFATHGIIDSRTPALSGLMLSAVGREGRPTDGFLGLGDVYNLRLGADLVVLSGCETALGKEVRGEGLVGLTQGFLYAGARRVVASLWRVEDRATAELMARFYRGLLVERLPVPAALRRAQLAIRADRRWRSPYYWSGFVLQGDWQAASGSGLR